MTMVHANPFQTTLVILVVLGLCLGARRAGAEESWVRYDGFDGPGKGKHIVFVTGDDEYRSEESMPQMAKILAKHHGFTCTVLFAINKETGAIDPGTLDNIPGLEVLDEADLMVLFLRFRELPDGQMKHIMDYTNSGKPLMGLRTATHAFNYEKRKDSPYAQYSFNSANPPGGYGREVLGETWVAHYGVHKRESTRGIIAEGMKDHPLARGCEAIWGPSDVYALTTLHGDCTPVILGQVLQGMAPDYPPNTDKKPIPVAWTKPYTGSQDKTAQVFTTTMGHSFDFKSEGFRRLIANACYWLLGMEEQIPPRAVVDCVGPYDPSDIGFGKFKRGVMPVDHAM